MDGDHRYFIGDRDHYEGGAAVKKTIDFIEAKAERDGTITPGAVVHSLARYMAGDHTVDKIAIVVRHQDGTIDTAFSTMGHLELVGLHATAQAMAIEQMNED